MGFIKVSCPSCGANIDFDDSRDCGFCNYCGTKIMQDKVVVEHRGSVSIDRSSEINNLLIRAQEMSNKEAYSEAVTYYNSVLDIDANNTTARKGIELCNRLINEPNLTLTLPKSNPFSNAAMDVYIDDNLKAKLRPGQSVSLIESVGIHKLDVKIENGNSKCKPFQFVIRTRHDHNHLILRTNALRQVDITNASLQPNTTVITQKKKKKTGYIIAICAVCVFLYFIGTTHEPSESESNIETTSTTTVTTTVSKSTTTTKNKQAKPSTTTKPTTTTTTTKPKEDVDSTKQITLMMMNEDIAKALSNYPSTVEFETMSWTFEKEGNTYTTGSIFECLNAFGVPEKHILIVVSEEYNNGKSVKPKRVYLDGIEVPAKNN